MQVVLYFAVTLLEIGLASALVGLAQNSRHASRPTKAPSHETSTFVEVP